MRSVVRRRMIVIGAAACGVLLILIIWTVNLGVGHRSLLHVPDPSPLAKKYADLKVIDAHNHDAAGSRYKQAIRLWDAYGIDQVVLFAGRITDPEAVQEDDIAWMASREHPERILPFFSGFDVNSEDSLAYVQERFEQGFLGIGEYVGASYAPDSCAYDVGWKPKHPMDGYFSDVYTLCARYKAPILLHVDPPFPDSISMRKFEEAIAAHPETTFIFAHANAFNTPENLERLLETHPNLYLDFFPGFNIYDERANLPVDAYIPLIEKYRTKVLVSTDSGCGMEYYQAYEAIYELLEKVSPDTRERIAFKNFDGILERRRSVMERDASDPSS
ncbi:MAG: amidohydrolase family protein [Planctomycetes bacterium]|nr:amidohydrolase family protein [Planctomycetota bacterium]